MSREIGVRGAEILPAAAPARARARVRRRRRRRGGGADAAAIFAVLSWARRAGERVVVGEPHARWPASLLIEKTEEWTEAAGGWICA
jgi:hypothetical protein